MATEKCPTCHEPMRYYLCVNGTDEIGTCNHFRSLRDARQGIAGLRRLGREWQYTDEDRYGNPIQPVPVEYRIVEF